MKALPLSIRAAGPLSLLAIAGMFVGSSGCGEVEPSSAASSASLLWLTDSSIAVRAEGVEAVGTGCPAGRWRAITSQDGTQVAFAFDRFYVSGGGPLSRQCDLTVKLGSDESVSLSPESIRVQVKTSLANGTSGVMSLGLGWPGGALSMWGGDHVVERGRGKERLFDAHVSPETWSACGRRADLKVHSELELLDPEDALSELRVVRLDNLALDVRRCEQEGPDASVGDAGSTVDAGASLDGSVGGEVVIPKITAVTSLRPGCIVELDPERADGTLLVRGLGVNVDGTQSLPMGACDIDYDLEGPAGRALKVEQFEVEGSAALQAGVIATLRSTHTFSIQTPGEGIPWDIEGGTTGPIGTTVRFGSDEQPVSRCGPINRLSVGLRLFAKAQTAGATGHVEVQRIGPPRFVAVPCAR